MITPDSARRLVKLSKKYDHASSPLWASVIIRKYARLGFTNVSFYVTSKRRVKEIETELKKTGYNRIWTSLITDSNHPYLGHYVMEIEF